ncbi:hypothetical protein N9M31_08370, partial [Alphaproteobacteria bacterium]|nr:hypothetical protein [Alphaproteobacteria bacterium]
VDPAMGYVDPAMGYVDPAMGYVDPAMGISFVTQSLGLGSDNLTGSASNDLFYLDAQVALGGIDNIQGSGGTDRLVFAKGEGVFSKFDALGAGNFTFDTFNAVPTLDDNTSIISTSTLNLTGLEEVQVSYSEVNMANPGNENVLDVTALTAGSGYTIVGTSLADNYALTSNTSGLTLLAHLGEGDDVLSINSKITSGFIDMGSGSDTLNVGPTTILSADHALLEFSADGEVAIGYSTAYGSEFDRSSLFLKAKNVETIGKNAFLDGVGQVRDLEISFNPTEFTYSGYDNVNYNGNAGTLTTESFTKGQSDFNIASAVDRIFGTSGNDTIFLGSSDFAAFGGAGDDVMEAMSSGQVLVGGLGADRITYNVGGTTLKYDGATFQDLANEIMGDNINGGYLNSQYDYGTGANQGVLDSSTIIELGKLPISYMGSQISAAPTQVNIDSGQNFGSVGNYEIGLFDLSASFGMTNQNGGGNVVIAIDNGDGYLSGQDIFIDVDDDFVSFEISEGIGALGDTTTMITNFA